MPYTYEYPRPAVTVDVVPFGLRDGKLKVLLIRRKHDPFRGAWAVPGGFLNMDELMEDCARRELLEETGLTDVPLHFLRCYDRPDRDPRGRTLTLAYIGIVGPGAVASPGDDAADAAWHDVRRLPEMAFDHAELLEDATALLRERGRRSALLFGLLPARFTMGELQRACEAVYGRPVDRRRLAARLLSRGILRRRGRAGRERRYELQRDAALAPAPDAPLLPLEPTRRKGGRPDGH